MANATRPRDVGAGRFSLARWRSLFAPGARQILKFGLVALAASWLGFYFITGLPYIELETFRATINLHVVTGLVFIPYLVSLVVARRLPGGSPLDVPLVALLGVYLAGTVFSLDWRVSLEVALTAIMAIGVFYVLSDGRALRRWQLEAALMAALLATAVYALWIVGGDYLDWLQLTDAVRGSISAGDLIPPTVPKLHDVGDHPNILGGMLAMALPFFLVAVFRPLPRPLRALAAAALLVIALAVFLSLARSAWLAAGAGAFTSALLLAFATPGGRAFLGRLVPSRPRWRWLLAAATLAVLVVAAIAAVSVLQSVEARPLWLFRASGGPRLDVLGAGAEMIQDYPLYGTGPGLYSLLYPEYSGQFPLHAFHSHNGYLQVAIDLGAFGVAAMILLAAALLWLLAAGLRRAQGGALLSLIACAGALAAFATFSLFDAPNGFKGPLVALAAVGAVAALSYRDAMHSVAPPREGGRWPRLDVVVQLGARVLVPVALAGLLVTWGRLDAAHFYYSEGVANANAARWPEAIAKAERAVELDPQYALYRLQLGVTEGAAYLETRRPALLESALGQLERAVELEPRSAIALVNLSMLLAQGGDRAGARERALAAIEFANSDPAVVLAAGTALETANYGTEAVAAYARAIALDAGLADSPFWNSSSFRRARYLDIIAQSGLVFNTCGYLELARDDLPPGRLTRDQALVACEAQVAANPDDLEQRVSYGGALIDEGDLDAAFVQIDYVLVRQPDNGRARTEFGRWYAAQGEVDAAREQWLLAGQLNQAPALVLLGDSYPPGQVPPEVIDELRSELRGEASQVQFHLIGILYYRSKFFRVSPHVTLLPGEWQQAVPARYSEAVDALERWTAPR